MKVVIKYHVGLLLCLALLLNIYFLSVNFKNGFFPLQPLHGEVGYNFYKFDSLKRNSEISRYLATIKKSGNSTYGINSALVDLHYAMHEEWPHPHQYNPVYETVGYGLILGLLWKITHSLSYFDIQVLQILLYVLSMFLVYHLALLLFGCTRIAFCIGIVHLFYFPLIFLNVQVMRDAWSYYGLLALAWAITYRLKGKGDLFLTGCAVAFFGLCQFIRPIGIPAIITMSLVLLILGIYYKQWKRILTTLLLLWVVTGIFFWLPFMTYNKYAYNRYISGPTGQLLMEGWGEFKNPGNYEIDDGWFVTYISDKYNISRHIYGMPEFDDAAKKEVLQVIKENKWEYAKSILWRLPQMFMPHLPWHDETAPSPFADCKNVFEKIIRIFKSCDIFFYFIFSHGYMIFFFLLGYLGIYCLYIHKNYLALAILLFGTICSGQLIIISHFEARYQIAFYWPMSFFAGYFIYNFYYTLMQRLRSWKHAKNVPILS